MKAIPRLIAIEGPHGSGKTTLAKALAKRLSKKGLRSTYTKEPYSPILKQAISSLASKSGRDPLALAYLISADRQLHLGQIRNWIRRGSLVISDRYLDSSYVYQRIDGIPSNLISQLNFFVPNPKLRILIKAPYEVRLNRIKKKLKQRPNHTFLSANALRREQALYSELQPSKATGKGTLVLDGTRSIRENVEIAERFVMTHI
jgi:dTMP kinase